MAIVATDILFKLSIKTGAAGNASAQADPNASLGTYISTTQLSATALNNLFDDISGADNANSVVEYRCVFVHNAHATLPLTNAVLWLSGGDPAGGAVVTVAVDSTAASAIGSATAQALTATTETAPGAGVTGLAYSAPTTSGTGLALGTIGAGQCKAFWVKRAAANTAAVTAETVTFAVTGDTAA
ncbi:hypothetical protein DDP54_15520 (plasmid) [Cellulomonas sp. WB94]|uniref:hypothetical protein n=1 Tax=Cellulomonas sp. WB94 TaxID=2173174 RepID=UPI000D580E0B|nr:hypothetical protein [Cellulomonas sp. WB94]PVU81311.1 hypothetical protein DDP54_15520 [Cellulomonas sp. WB94]